MNEKVSSSCNHENDSISRQEALDALDKEYRCTDRSDDWDGLKTAMLIIENLPSAQIERDIPLDCIINEEGDAICPKCGANVEWHKYCEECGQALKWKEEIE